MKIEHAIKLMSRLPIRHRDSGLAVPFKLNPNQVIAARMMMEQEAKGLPLRLCVLKSRRVGMSSLIDGLGLCHIISQPLSIGRIVAHLDKSVEALFRIPKSLVQGMQQNISSGLFKPPTQEKIIAIHAEGDSELSISTAGSTQGGRGDAFSFLHLCLRGDALVNTLDGNLVPISELQIGDWIRTHTGQHAQVKFISSRPSSEVDDGQALEIKTWLNFTPVVLTPSHKVWAKRGWVKAGELTAEDWIGTPRRKFANKIQAIYIAPRFRKDNRGKFTKSGSISLDKEFGFFCGYYLAEGSLCRNYWKGVTHFSSVTFTHHESEFDYAERAYNAVKPLVRSMRGHVRKGTKTGITTLQGSSLAKWVAQTLGVKDSKKIPEWFFDAPPEFGEGLVLGYAAGDGSKHMHTRAGYVAPTMSITSIRPRLLYQLRNITAALGWGWGGITFEHGWVDKRGWNNADSWTLHLNGHCGMKVRKELGLSICEDSERRTRACKYRIDDDYIWTKIKTITPAKADTVWDIEVDHVDHSFETVIGAVANSEAAYYAGEGSFTSLLNAVPDDPSTTVCIESTANGKVGIGESFYRYWKDAESGRNGYLPIFLSWLDDPACVRDPQEAKDAPIDQDEKDLIKHFNATKAQLAWRRWCIFSRCGGYFETFYQEYPSHPDEAFIATGNPAFIKEELTAARASVREGVSIAWSRTESKKIEFQPGGNGSLVFFERPKEGHSYRIGVDAARGEELTSDGKSKSAGDFAAATVIDASTMEVVARFADRVSPGIFAELLNTLGRYYNNAMMCIELTGGWGAWVQTLLRDNFNYPFFYMWKGFDDKARAPKAARNQMGWKTTVSSREKLFTAYREALREQDLQVRDVQCVTQMEQAERVTGRWEVKKGHDDVLFSQLLANIAVQHYPASRLFGKPKNTAEDDTEEQLKTAVNWKPGHEVPVDGKGVFIHEMLSKHVKDLELGSKLKGRVQPLQGI